MRPILPLLGLALFSTTPAVAPAQRPSATQLTAFVDSVAQAAVTTGQTASLTVAVWRGGQMLLAKGYGFADIENDVRATDATVYRIGSITKQFTSAAIMQLAEQGKLSLEDDLTKWVPDWPTHGHPIAIRQLLNHTGGVHNYTSVKRWVPLQPLDLSHDSLLALVRDDTLDFAPGTKWSYSNTGYYLLGVIIEKASGQSYAEYVRTHEFEPLGLSGSSYCNTAPIIKHRAHGYTPDGHHGYINSAFLSMSQPYAAGSLCSTVGDLVTWTRALESGRVVRLTSYTAMTTPLPLADGTAQGYGFGLGVGTLEGHRVVSHNGGINGFRSQLASYPNDSLVIAVLANTETSVPDQVEKRIARRALGILEPVAKDLPVSAAEASREVGEYSLSGQPVQVKLEGGKLVVVLPESEPMPLLYQGDGLFVRADQADFKVRFVGTGVRADHMEVSVPGQTITLPRR